MEVQNYKAYPPLGKQAFKSNIDWEVLESDIGYDMAIEIIKSWDSTSEENEVIRQANIALYQEALDKVKPIFAISGVAWFKDMFNNPKKGITKEALLFDNKLRAKFRIAGTTKPQVYVVSYKGVDIVREPNSLKCLERAKSAVEPHKQRALKESNKLSNSLKVAAENGIDITDCTSADAIYRHVNAIMMSRWEEANYPDGTVVKLKNICDGNCTWTVGNKRCDCEMGRRIGLQINGDFIDGFDAYPEGY